MLEPFPVFEGLNGARSHAHNAFAWYATGNTVRYSPSAATRTRTAAELIANIRDGRTAICGAFGTPENLSDDVWILLQKILERHMAEASTLWGRLTCRAVRRFGEPVYPLICLRYHNLQSTLMRDFARALPA